MVPRASRRVVAAAQALGLPIEVLEFPAGTKTARDAAAAVGCELGQIVKSLVFVADEHPVLALVPGDQRLDEQRLADAVGAASIRRATLDEVRTATGFVAGGTPPIGHGLPTWAARSLDRFDVLFAAAGTPTTVFRVGRSALLEASGASVADLT